MEIVTKFNINDLIQYKYQRESEGEGAIVCCYEVIETHTVTCMAGTQTFYDCRAINRIYKSEWKNDTKLLVLIDIAFGIGKRENSPYIRFREDEIKACPEAMVKQIKGEL